MRPSWLSRLFARRNRAARRARIFRPSFETLDRRDVPAVTAAFDAATGTLTVASDGAADAVTVTQDAAGTLHVQANGAAVAIANGVATAMNTTMIAINGGGGADTLTIDPSVSNTISTVLTGGTGNDTMIGGGGNDTFVWNPGEGSDTIEGNGGTDTLQFNGANVDENIDLSNNNGRLRFFRDAGNITIDAAGIENVNFAALGGSDTITVGDLTGLGVQQVNVDLAAAPGGTTGDGQFDQVTVNGTAVADNVQLAAQNGVITVTGPTTVVNVKNADPDDGLTIKGFGGDDTIDARGLAGGLVSLTIDGGTGNDTITGSDGADRLIGDDGNDLITGRKGDDVAFMGAGDDTFVWNPGDGNDTVEGQDGTDELRFNGANVNENVEISANGSRVLFFRDVATVVMDLNSTERITFNALGGIDNVVVGDLTGTATKDVFVNLGGSLASPATGDGKPDVVVVTGTPGNDNIKAAVVGGEIRVNGLAAVTHVTGTDAGTDNLLADGGGGNDTIDLSAIVTALPQPGLTSTIAVGADAGGAPLVTTFNADGSVKGTTAVFNGAFAGGVRVAVADVNGDGTQDTIVGTGPGAPTQVRVLDGKTGAELLSVNPFEASFTGGVFVAAGDLNGDGKADLVITPDEGGGPRVRVLSGVDGSPLADFFGIEDPNFRGGARAALGDANNDGTPDLIVAAGFGGGPRVAGFDGKSVLAGHPAHLFNDFFVFEQTLRNGVFVTSGDLNGDGFADVILGGGPGGGPRVLALSGKDLVQSGSASPVQLANFFAGDPNNRGGVRLAVKDLDGDTQADLVVGAGTGAGSRVTAFAGKSIPTDGAPPELFAFDAFAGFTGGVFVG
jgi:hypothetical protein